MPSKTRRVLPKLSIFSRQPTSTTTTSTTTSTTTATRSTSVFSPPTPTPTPLTPPARLHLRNVLPTSPDALPTPPPPPRQPYPWLWQCHACLTVYRLGCTRRCLQCGHEYCVSARPATSTSSTSTSTSTSTANSTSNSGGGGSKGSNGSGGSSGGGAGKRGRKRRRAHGGSGMCASEFDYGGWAEWGAWRRKVLGRPEARGRAFADRGHHCALDCDFPSECHHERYRLATEARQRERMLEKLAEEQEAVAKAEEEVVVTSPTFVPRGVEARERRRSLGDDELPLNEALELCEEEGERREERDGDAEPKSPTSPLRQSSFFWDEVDLEERKRRELEEEERSWWAEEDKRQEEQTRRAKSSKKIQQLTGIELNGPYKADTPAADASTMDPATRYALAEEDADLMPVDELKRCESRHSHHEGGSGSSTKLALRHRTDAQLWEDWDSDSSDSDTDSSSSSSSDDDDEWFPAQELSSGAESHGVSTRSHSLEDVDRDLKALVKVRNAFLKEEVR
ncbi:hypothetical protein F5B20DRAFT_575952 [Whalleya microplaca]|nr:hypothetical protein F5B20DRAFT_575952 [Whalleya microplaca]